MTDDELERGYNRFKKLVVDLEWDGDSRPIAVEIWTFHKYIKYVEALRNAISKFIDDQYAYLIFRGCSDVNYQLMPSIMREDIFPDVPSGGAVEKYEKRIMREFKKKARPYVNTLPRPERKEWEWLARAQHHFLPTRLLDWTERAGTALFFALEENDSDQSCVWAIASPDEIEITDEMVPKDIKIVQLYKPPHIAPRIVVQQGCFTIHPSDYREKNHNWINGPQVKFVIKRKNRDIVMKGLEAVGVNRGTLFPDLDGLAKYLKETIRPL